MKYALLFFVLLTLFSYPARSQGTSITDDNSATSRSAAGADNNQGLNEPVKRVFGQGDHTPATPDKDDADDKMAD